MDEFPAHKTQEVLNTCEEIGLKTFLIPGGFTNCLQLLDVSLNKPFKQYLKDEWDIWFNGPAEFTKNGNRKKPSYENIFQMVSSSLIKLSLRTQVIKKVKIFCIKYIHLNLLFYLLFFSVV